MSLANPVIGALQLQEREGHKDLDSKHRPRLEGMAEGVVHVLHASGQSLAIAREAWINAFDKAAEELGNA